MVTEIEISKVVIGERIRKDMGDIEELAESIKELGLIQPIVVTPDYELLAGHRRLMAAQSLGWEKIKAVIMPVTDGIHKIAIEGYENEIRKSFTFSERMRFAALVEPRYKKAAEEAKRQCLVQYKDSECKNVYTREKIGRVDEKVAKEVGFGSHTNYAKAKEILAHGNPEIIAQLDEGTISINKAYQQVLAEKRALEEELQKKEDALKKKDEEMNLERASMSAKLERQVAKKAELEEEVQRLRKEASIEEVNRLKEQTRLYFEKAQSLMKIIEESQKKLREANKQRENLEAELASYKEQLNEVLRNQARNFSVVQDEEEPKTINDLDSYLNEVLIGIDDFGSVEDLCSGANRSEIELLHNTIKELKGKVEEMENAIEKEMNSKKVVGFFTTKKGDAVSV